MIELATRKAKFEGMLPAGDRSTVRVSSDHHRPLGFRSREAYLVSSEPVPQGFAWYILVGQPQRDLADDVRVIRLPAEFAYLADGDVLRLAPASGSVRVLFRKNASINSFLLTERCNNYCLMCSQPPRDVNDGWIVGEILDALPLIDRSVRELMFSGGEPTLLGDRFHELVRATKSYLPNTALHVLSNGRSFSDPLFAAKLGEIGHHDLMVGVPVYSDLAHIHDYIVQADGAFDETIRGILNLKKAGVAVEIRVVLHKQTIPRLASLAEFLTRNLLFVDHVALMGLEMTGFTKANLAELWIDPAEYAGVLKQAVGILDRARVKTSIYNTQLCLLDRSLWAFARRSISDWKQEYMPECDTCAVKADCGGFFSSAAVRYSDHIRPIAAEQTLAALSA